MRKYEGFYIKIINFQQDDVVTTSGLEEVQDAFIYGDIFE